ncbi:hypothetical protein Nepgr_022229 [Nepenthes gracilis]|uniref:Uncharacterized protein n=1 Tax=Nepenthes gracilis TaxID=150966 RepID=A0AAD3SYC9_NEPGR|nr:hypothetical protein Nepgr_022229 [Nepenthes gracilis]
MEQLTADEPYDSVSGAFVTYGGCVIDLVEGESPSFSAILLVLVPSHFPTFIARQLYCDFSTYHAGDATLVGAIYSPAYDDRKLQEVATLFHLQHQHVVCYYQTWVETDVAGFLVGGTWDSRTAVNTLLNGDKMETTNNVGFACKLLISVTLILHFELKTLVELHGNEARKGGKLTHDETTIIVGALELTEKTAGDAMAPISETFAIDINAQLDRDLMNSILGNGHSRLPVYYEESMSRPFGVSLLIAGHDEHGPSLYYTDPSGTFWQCNAKAIGSGSEGADSSLQEQYNSDLSLQEAEICFSPLQREGEDYINLITAVAKSFISLQHYESALKCYLLLEENFPGRVDNGIIHLQRAHCYSALNNGVAGGINMPVRAAIVASLSKRTDGGRV